MNAGLVKIIGRFESELEFYSIESEVVNQGAQPA
jgi:hypothetical protein